MEYASGKGGAIQIEGGRKEIDLLFPFRDFVVDDVLDYLLVLLKGKGTLSSFPQLLVFSNSKPKPTERK